MVSISFFSSDLQSFIPYHQFCTWKLCLPAILTGAVKSWFLQNLWCARLAHLVHWQKKVLKNSSVIIIIIIIINSSKTRIFLMMWLFIIVFLFVLHPQLAQMEEDPEVDHVGTNPFEEDDMENELQNGDTMVVKNYHDDSDDDMLLWWNNLKWGKRCFHLSFFTVRKEWDVFIYYCSRLDFSHLEQICYQPAYSKP